MFRILLPLLMVICSLPLPAQDPPKVELIERKNGNGVVVEKYKIVDGKKEGAYQSFFDDGTKKSVGTHLHDRRHGSWVDYHSNGNKRFEGNYDKGDLSGAASEFHPNGQVSKTTTFAGGYAKGTFTTYFENGQVNSSGEVSSSKQNQLDHVTHEGAWKWYYPDGTIEWEITFKKGNWHGNAVQYHNNGSKQLQGTFENGYAKGVRKCWYDNGQIESEGEVSSGKMNNFDHPVRQGHWKYYYRDGVVRWDGSYENSNWHGEIVNYYENGNEHHRCNFAKGYAQGTLTSHHANGQLDGQGDVSSSEQNKFEHFVYQGPWIQYHDNGNKRWEGTCKDSNWDGQVTQYHLNGVKQFESTFSSGIASGTWTEFHPNGQIAAIGEAAGNRRNAFDRLVRTGQWVGYYEDGILSFEGIYVEGNLDGIASWYHPNGQKSALTEWVEGKMRGNWTGWYDNGNKWGHGYSYDGSGTSPKKHGPWVWYHSNGKKSSEGKYRYDQLHGPWVYYDTMGLVDKVLNYDNGRELKGNSEAVLHDGSRIISTSNPDGSRDTYKIDKDGNLVDHEHTLPPDKQKPSITYTDPDTGETTTLTHDGDGNPKITKGKTTKDEDGTTHTHEEDDDGTVRDITTHLDGSREFREVRPDGTVRESTRDKDGNIVRKQTNPDGTTTEYTLSPDGRKTRTLRDADGNIIEEAERKPVGVETVKQPDGTETRRHKDEDGNWVETTTRPDGTTSRVVRDKEGNVISRDDKWGEREEGQSLYEDVQGGRNWDQLTPEEKAAYADLEGRMTESGQLDEARRNALDGEMQRRDEARAGTDAALEEAGGDLQRKPATEGATRPAGEINKDELGIAAKALELALRMPDVPFEKLMEELKESCGGDEAKLADLLKQKKDTLPAWLDRNSDVGKKWAQAVKSGGSSVAGALAVAKAVDHLFKGEYGAALEEFVGANASAFGAIPESTMARIEKELGRNPSNYASALKNLVAIGREVSRELKPDESYNYGKLLNEGVNFMVNAWKALPEDKRNDLLKAKLPSLHKLIDQMDDSARRSASKKGAALMKLLECAPEAFTLISEWGGENDVANITSLTQKVGPKVIGMLVSAATRSDTAGEVAEFVAQLGTDYMAHLGNDAREAAKAAMLQAGTEANSYANLRNTMRSLAQKAGMSPRDAEQYEFLSNLVSGHESRLVLGDMRRAKDVLGVHEAMQAWRRVDTDLGKQAGAVGFFYGGLVDKRSRSSADERAYQIWKTNQVNNARRTAAHIKSILPEYAPGSAAHKFLSHWKNDLEGMVRTFG